MSDSVSADTGTGGAELITQLHETMKKRVTV
jgi:hypothetical protein